MSNIMISKSAARHILTATTDRPVRLTDNQRLALEHLTRAIELPACQQLAGLEAENRQLRDKLSSSEHLAGHYKDALKGIARNIDLMLKPIEDE